MVKCGDGVSLGQESTVAEYSKKVQCCSETFDKHSSVAQSFSVYCSDLEKMEYVRDGTRLTQESSSGISSSRNSSPSFWT